MNREDFGGADRLQDGVPGQHHAGPNPDPIKGSQRGQ